tara:strand:+ start:381 stop:542 length:162 start_codon:yes stop_codon:yes gene_type:complete
MMVSPAPARDGQDKSKPAGQANDKVSQPRGHLTGGGCLRGRVNLHILHFAALR